MRTLKTVFLTGAMVLLLATTAFSQITGANFQTNGLITSTVIGGSSIQVFQFGEPVIAYAVYDFISGDSVVVISKISGTPDDRFIPINNPGVIEPNVTAAEQFTVLPIGFHEFGMFISEAPGLAFVQVGSTVTIEVRDFVGIAGLSPVGSSGGGGGCFIDNLF